MSSQLPFVSHCLHQGLRERQLKRALMQKRGLMEAGMARRIKELKRVASDTRGRSRSTNTSYIMYKNKLAVTH